MKNIVEILNYGINRFPEREALKYKDIENRKHSVTYLDLAKLVTKLSENFKRLRLGYQDRAVIISENRYEWIASDLSIMALGAITVPIYPVLSSKQTLDIINEIKPKIIIVSNEENFRKVQPYLVLNPKVRLILMGEGFADTRLKGVYYTFNELIVAYKKNGMKQWTELISNLINNYDDTATIVYTSGTSGNFKGIVLTHENILSNINGIREKIVLTEKDTLLSILPLAHAFERTCGHFTPLSAACSICYINDVKNVQKDLLDFKPTIILGVPRIFEKIYTKISQEIVKIPAGNKILSIISGSRRSIITKALKPLFSRKIRAVFGGRIRMIICGSATISEEVSWFFNNLDIAFLEGYGLTEASPVVSCSSINENKIGCVGKILNNVTYKISEDKELLISGDSVAKKYLSGDDYNSLLNGDWLHTGDLVSLDKEGYLSIIGRKKEIIVLSTGKKIVPTKIEETLEVSNLIEQAFVFGDGMKYICALIYPNRKYISENNGDSEPPGEDYINALIEKEISAQLIDFASYEKIKKFQCIDEPFSVENGMLTPTLKLKRLAINNHYGHLIKRFL